MQVVISAKAGVISGVVVNGEQKPVSGSTVALVPESAKRRAWPHFYSSAIADQYGRFTLKNIDPGDYRIYAWETIENRGWLYSDVIDAVKGRGVKLTVDPSGRHSVRLEVIPAE